MEKGVSIAQVARVTEGFTQAGIMVHAYLMYGFPTQTAQETIDSLEVVRQLFANNVIQSGFWHRFSMTAHSPIGRHPEKYGVVKIGPEQGNFAYNDLWHDDPQGTDHEIFGKGLAKAIYNFMHGIGLEENLQFWFDFKVPRTTVAKNLIYNAIAESGKTDYEKRNLRLLWFGNVPEKTVGFKPKKPNAVQTCKLTFYEKAEDFEMELPEITGNWLLQIFEKLVNIPAESLRLKDAETTYPVDAPLSFAAFLDSVWWQELREKGLLLV